MKRVVLCLEEVALGLGKANGQVSRVKGTRYDGALGLGRKEIRVKDV